MYHLVFKQGRKSYGKEWLHDAKHTGLLLADLGFLHPESTPSHPFSHLHAPCTTWDYLVHTISFLAATISFSICAPSHPLPFYRVGYKPPTSTAPQPHQYICLQVTKSLFVMCRELMLLQTPFPKTFCTLPCGWESSILALVLEICPGSSSLVWRLSPGDQAHGTPG